MTTVVSDERDWGGLWNAIQGAGAAAGGLAYAGLISDRGQQYADQMGTLAGQLQNDAAFKGYGVKTGLANSTIGADGSLNLGIGQNEALANYANTMNQGATSAFQQAQRMAGAYNRWAGQASNMMNQGYGQMAGAFDNIAGREQEIYNRAMAMQQPALDAQRASGNAAEYAAGRGGVMGSQFGGSGEDAAMARAQAQAQNQAAFQAMGQAQQEATNQANVGNQMFGAGAGYNQAGLGNAQLSQAGANTLAGIGGQMGQLGQQGYANSYLGMQNQLQALQAAQSGANMAQTGQLTGTGYGAQLGLGGIQTAVNADKAASEMYGNIVAAMMNNANAGDGEQSWLGGLVGGLFDF